MRFWFAAAFGLILIDTLVNLLVQHDRFPTPGLLCWYSLMFSQAGLICLWSSLSTTFAFWRALGGTGGLLSIGLALSTVQNSAGQWLLLLLLQAAVIGLPLWWARSRGVRLARLDNPAASGGPLQFSLRHMLWGTTGIAVLMAVVRTLDMSTMLPRGRMVGELVVLSGALGAIALASAWAGWGDGSRAVRLAVSLGVSAAAGLVMARATSPQGEYSLILLAVVTGAMLSAYLSAMRWRGYGLLWQASPAQLE